MAHGPVPEPVTCIGEWTSLNELSQARTTLTVEVKAVQKWERTVSLLKEGEVSEGQQMLAANNQSLLQLLPHFI